jgi:Cu(I)/Ag(I) efflux system membrane fusion protein
MTASTRRLIPLLLLTAAAGGGLGYVLGERHTRPAAALTPATAAAGANILYWYDPMKPDQHFDKPGKSPFMDMDLIPKYADAGPAASGVAIDSRVQQNLGIRLATTARGRLDLPLDVPAAIGFNERDVAIVQLRAGGFVEHAPPRAAGDLIHAGEPLLTVLVPEWAGAQTEFLALKQAGDERLTDAGRQRLRLLGMPDALIRAVERDGKPQPLYTLTAPISGVIQSLEARQGMTLSPGMTVARINGLGTVWLEAAVPETMAARLQPGMPATARLAAEPDRPLTGRVQAILPQADAQSRTVRVRLVFPNPDGRLRPGQFARVSLTTTGRDSLLIPAEALIRTGRRTVVILADGHGRFQPVEVTPGAEADGRSEILSGLAEGDRVVASGQFLIDSEAGLQGVLARLASGGPVRTETTPSAAPAPISAYGVVEAVGPGEITLSHDAIPALDWPAMTMPFATAPGVGTAGLKPGQRIRFFLAPDADEPRIMRIETGETRP